MRHVDKQILRDWDEYRKSLINDTFVDDEMSESERQAKREALERDPIEWIQFFFPKFAYAEFAPFQKRAIKRLINNPEFYDVLSWSRELSKSTITMFVLMYLTLTGRKRFVFMASNSSDNAKRLLTPYKINFESNKRIRAFYGDQVTLGAWEDGEFTIRAGASFRAIGSGQSPRGARNEEIRPDVIATDDFDTDEECRNPDIIQKKWDWWEGSLYATRSISQPLLVIWCGNIIAKDCCVVRASKNADNHDIINIRDKNGKSTWPQKNSEDHIDRCLSKISTKAQQQEYFNNPLSSGEVFKELTWGKVPDLSRFRFLVAYGDPATSNKRTKGSGGNKGLFLVGALDGKFYVITGYLDKGKNSEYVDWFYYLHAFVKGKTQVYSYTENNSLQDPFYQQVFLPLFNDKAKEHGYTIPIKGDDRKKPDKPVRIEGNLEPLNIQGKLILNEAERENPHMKRLADQFELFSMTMRAPAEGPDAIEGAVCIINQKNATLTDGAVHFGRRKKNNKRI
jgi:hypothetical protein